MSRERESEALKPCPFCEGRAATHPLSEQWKAICGTCGATVSLALRRGEDALIAAWNTRAPSTPVEPTTPTFNETSQSLKVADLEAVREAAAKVVDEHGRAWGLSYRSMTDSLAAAIRSMTIDIKAEKG